jgi:FecR protein
MPKKILCSLTLISSTFLLGALAESPVGTVGGKGALEISGSLVNLTTLSSLPLAPGDTIKTLNGSAIISLSDKSRVLLEKDSQVKVEGSGRNLSIYLLKGGLSFKMSSQSPIRIVAQNQEMRSPLQTTGSVTLASGTAISSSKASTDFEILKATAGPTSQKAKSPKNCKDNPCDKDCVKGNDKNNCP